MISTKKFCRQSVDRMNDKMPWIVDLKKGGVNPPLIGIKQIASKLMYRSLEQNRRKFMHWLRFHMAL